MVQTPDITRPPKEIIDGLREVGSATTAGVLPKLGIRDPHLARALRRGRPARASSVRP